MKGVLFDLDGTLLDTTEYIAQAFEYSLGRHDISDVTREILYRLMGQGKSLPASYQVLTKRPDVTSLRMMHEEFQDTNVHLVQPYAGVLSVLQHLKNENIKIAIITNRIRKSVLETIQANDLHHYYDVLITCDDVVNPKPHPEPVLKALDELNLQADEVYMVGDSHADISSAQAAGVKTVGALWGFSPQAVRESKPDFMIRAINELENMVLR